MSASTSLQPPHRAFEGVASGGLVRLARGDVVERHGDVRVEDPLDVGRALRSEVPARPVDMALELDAVLLDPAETFQREYLEAARVGQERTFPAHEAVQTAERRNDVFARAHVQVVGVGEHQACADGREVARRERAHGPLRAHRHEDRRLHRTVG